MTLQIEAFDELDSTSAEASRWLADHNVTAPVAFWAKRQSLGKGRGQRTWASPEGNLYLSLLLPKDWISPEIVTWTPLKVAVLTCWWVAIQYNRRLTLKWPNDLLFAGGKVGGILCESSTQGTQLGQVVIGIGINLKVAPQLSDGENEGICLKDFVESNAAMDPWRMAKSLGSFLVKHWQNYSIAEVKADYEHFAMEPGQLWMARLGGQLSDFRLYGGLTTEGYLSWKEETSQPIVSTDHHYTWIYAEPQRKRWPVVLCDIGNTTSKFAVYASLDHPQPEFVARTDQFTSLESVEMAVVSALKQLLPAPVKELPKVGWPVLTSSVNPLQLQKLNSSFHELNILRLIQRPVSYRGTYDVAAMGMDRLCLVEAVLALHLSPERACVVVSIGTALTIDAVSGQQGHLGGWIAAGPQLSLNALADGCALLPSLTFASADSVSHNFGLDTKSAILIAEFQTVVAQISRARQLCASMLSIKESDIRVLLTGGYASHFVEAIPDAQHLPNLIFDGMRILAGGGLKRYLEANELTP